MPVKDEEIRVDYRTGTQVIFSGVRNNKPIDFHLKDEEWKTDVEKCPFEYGKESLNKTLMLVGGDEHSWELKVIQNKFPLVSPDFDFQKTGGFFEEKPAFGYSEVIIDTPKHNVPFYKLTEDELLVWLNTIIKREQELYSKEKIGYVYAFKNEGPKSGASISHTHTQLMAFPELTHTILEEKKHADDYLRKNNRCLYEDAIKYEKERVLEENDTFIAVAPFGSKFNAESIILPRRHISCSVDLSGREKTDLCRMLSHTVKSNEKIFGNLSYNIIFHELKNDKNFHFHIEIYPRVITFAAVEFAGFNTNQLNPETYVKMFRENNKN